MNGQDRHLLDPLLGLPNQIDRIALDHLPPERRLEEKVHHFPDMTFRPIGRLIRPQPILYGHSFDLPDLHISPFWADVVFDDGPEGSAGQFPAVSGYIFALAPVGQSIHRDRMKLLLKVVFVDPKSWASTGRSHMKEIPCFYLRHMGSAMMTPLLRIVIARPSIVQGSLYANP